MTQANKNNFSKGAFQLSRSLFESDIWFMPPEYLKIWVYLIGKANHAGRKYRGFYCDRGQYFCTYSELTAQIEYSVGFRKKKYYEHYMKNTMKYLRNTGLITSMKKPRGLLVTIPNYSDYQNLSNYEKTIENTTENTMKKLRTSKKTPAINKNDKELKNDKDIYTIFNFWNEQKIILHKEMEKYKSHISARLKNYCIEEIKEAICNYSTILKSNEHYFTHKWGLDEFLSKKGGLDKFITANDPFNNFKKGKGQSGDKQQTERNPAAYKEFKAPDIEAEENLKKIGMLTNSVF